MAAKENPSDSVNVDVLLTLMDVRDTLARMEQKIDSAIRQYGSLESRVEAVERRQS